MSADDEVTLSPVRFGRTAGAVWRSTPGMLVVTVGTASPLRVSGSGSAVWQTLDTPVTVDEIVSRLLMEVDAPASVVERDVRRLLDELVAHGSVTAQ